MKLETFLNHTPGVQLTLLPIVDWVMNNRVFKLQPHVDRLSDMRRGSAVSTRQPLDDVVQIGYQGLAHRAVSLVRIEQGLRLIDA